MSEKPPVKVVKREEMPDDVRRLLLSLVAVLKRRYPNDWRRMLSEMGEVKVV